MQRAPDATSLTRNNNIRLAQTLRTATRNHTTFRDSSRYFILRRPVHFVGRCVARKASYDEVVPVGPAGTSTSYCPTLSFREHLIVTRRYALIVIASSSALLACRAPAEASKLPFLDAGWEALGGGPADLVFPEDFLGGKLQDARFLGTGQMVESVTRVGTPQIYGAPIFNCNPQKQLNQIAVIWVAAAAYDLRPCIRQDEFT